MIMILFSPGSTVSAEMWMILSSVWRYTIPIQQYLGQLSLVIRMVVIRMVQTVFQLIPMKINQAINLSPSRGLAMTAIPFYLSEGFGHTLVKAGAYPALLGTTHLLWCS